MSDSNITTGIVVDTNDPQQNNRLRVACALWGDDPDPKSMNLDDVPWATVVIPFGGMSTQGYRGTSSKVGGDIAYGLIGPIRKGSEVVVMAVNDDKSYRVITGVITPEHVLNTFPAGRYEYDGGYAPGPTSVNGQPVEPLSTNLSAHFTGPYGTKGYEWFSRGCDRNISTYSDPQNPRQQAADTAETEWTGADGKDVSLHNGYDTSRSGADPSVSPDSGEGKEPQLVGLVSPGQHMIVLGDSAEYCRVKIQTTAGHQFILDDTNERLYVATSKGANWIELDASGNIDVFSEQRVSIHSSKDVNITADHTIRLSANDIHFRAGNSIRAFAKNDLHVYSDNTIRTFAASGMLFETPQKVEVNTGTAITLSTTTISMKSDTQMSTTSNWSVGASTMILSADIIRNNDPGVSAPQAPEAAASSAKTAFHSNRIPCHEPWPRVLTDLQFSDADDNIESSPVDFKSGDMTSFEYKSYDDPSIGRIEYGNTISRNSKWHR